MIHRIKALPERNAFFTSSGRRSRSDALGGLIDASNPVTYKTLSDIAHVAFTGALL